MIKNAKVRTKVFILIGIEIFLLIIVGISGMLVMGKMENNSRVMYEERLVSDRLIANLLFGNARIDALQLELLITDDEERVQIIKQDFEQLRSNNQAVRKQLETTHLPPLAAQEYKLFLSLIPFNNQAKEKMDALQRAGHKDEAYQVYIEEYKVNREKMIQSLENTVKINEEEAEAFHAKSVQIFVVGISITIFITLLTIALCFLLGLRISSFITRPINRLRMLMVNAQQGDLSVRGRYDSSDEIGELVSGFNQMIVEREAAEKELKQYHDHLEQLVEQRTEELERKNLLLLDAKEAAVTANMAKSEFIANMSHELRTPINAILGFNYLLQQGELTEKQTEYVERVIVSVKSLLSIISDILDFSKIEANKLSLELIDFDIYEVLRNVSTMMSFRAEEKGLNLRHFIDPSVPRTLKGDPFRLSQIILNLTSNAIKFTGSGEVFVHVQALSIDESSTMLQIDVRDTGIGITEEQQSILFHAFTQADMSMTRRYGGTGLGLVISKNLAELMNGTIQVTSELGKGSCFTIVCKFDHAANIAVPIDTSSDNRVLSENELTERYTVLRNSHILLVEDNEINQIVATEILNQQGMLVDIANNGLEAVRMAQITTYDAILMDVQMPEMDGYEATRQIRCIPNQANTPIIAITADAIKGVKEQVLDAGMNDYITKPFEPIHLFSVLQRVMQRRAD